MRATKSGGRNGSLSIEQRQSLCRQAEENPSWTQSRLSKWVEDEFDVLIDRSTVSKVLKRRDEYMHGGYNLDAKRLRGVKYPELDSLLKDWCLYMQTTDSNISDRMIIAKAQKIAHELQLPEGALSFSNGWVDRFKKRNGLRQSTTTRGSRVAKRDLVPTAIAELQASLSGFKLQDIYSFAATKLYYSNLAATEAEYPGDNKESLLALLCCNADGSDMTLPMVVGQRHTTRALPSDIQYEFHPLAQLTDQTFQRWLRWFEDRTASRNVALILEEEHRTTAEKCHLRHIQIQFLPSDMTITPMKSGILRDFRARFKHSIVSRLAQLAAMDCTQSIIRLDLIDALMLVTQSWHGLSTAVIQDSWNVTKIVSQQQGSSRSVLQLPSMDSISVDTQAILDRLKCVAPATYAAFLALPECPETSNQQCPLILDNHHVVSEPHDSSATSNADSEDPAALQTTTQSFQHAINTCGLNPARDIGQQRLYSDQEAREAIRNLCLYFCYRTHSDAGARLMLEAEKLLEVELRNTRTSEPESTEQP